MKKLILAGAILAVASTSAFAQAAKPSAAQPSPVAKQADQPTQISQEQRQQKSAENQAKTFEKQYGLSADQYKGVYAACLEFVKNIESSRKSGKQMTREGFMELLAARDAKFKTVMTKEQYAKYEAATAKNMPQAAPAKQATAPATPVRK